MVGTAGLAPAQETVVWSDPGIPSRTVTGVIYRTSLYSYAPCLNTIFHVQTWSARLLFRHVTLLQGLNRQLSQVSEETHPAGFGTADPSILIGAAH